MRNIKLFTISYPFGNGEQFLQDEIDFISKDPETNVEIVPFYSHGELRELPANIHVNTSLSDFIESNSEKRIYPLMFGLLNIIKGIFRHPLKGISSLRDVAGFVHHGEIVKKWAIKNISPKDTLYTYWFERVTYGLALFKEKTSSNNPLITRAHGYDVYEARRKHGYIPFRLFSLSYLSQVFCISNDARNQIESTYGHGHKLLVSRLGISDNGKILSKGDEALVFVSCSSIIPLKRLDLILKSVVNFCLENSEKEVSWQHFGEGDQSIIDPLITDIPKNLKIHFHGQISNDELIEFYQNNYVDLFINLSDFEGIPVTIMEAISFGIPILARNVGGMSEIVNESNGFLLNADFEMEQTVQALTQIITSSKLREGARLTFEKYFNASKNYSDFYQMIDS